MKGRNKDRGAQSVIGRGLSYLSVRDTMMSISFYLANDHCPPLFCQRSALKIYYVKASVSAQAGMIVS